MKVCMLSELVMPVIKSEDVIVDCVPHGYIALKGGKDFLCSDINQFKQSDLAGFLERVKELSSEKSMIFVNDL